MKDKLFNELISSVKEMKEMRSEEMPYEARIAESLICTTEEDVEYAKSLDIGAGSGD